jgi:hypothetical protein
MNKYYCENCEKYYKSYKSLWEHNKKYHKNTTDIDIIQNSADSLQLTPDVRQITPKNSILDNFECSYCNNIYKRKDNLTKHEKKCKKKNNLIEENIILKEKLSNIEKQMSDIYESMDEMKKMLLQQMNTKCKTHPKTLDKINNKLANNNGIINNKGSITNNTNYIIALGKEDLSSILTNNEQINILNKKNNCLEHIIKQIHFNDKFPQFKNILITNSINNIAYIYDEKEQKFVATSKDDLLDKLIIHRMGDIEEFYETNLSKLEPATQKSIENFIDKMEDSESFLKKRKKNIKLLIYNNKDKVTQNLEIRI